MSHHKHIYKIVPRTDWERAEIAGIFTGAEIDITDGYIHFSTAEQVAETAAKHFVGQEDLLLVAVGTQAIDANLKWEISRGNALFPHLYAVLPMNAVAWAKPMQLDADGKHILPELES